MYHAKIFILLLIYTCMLLDLDSSGVTLFATPNQIALIDCGCEWVFDKLTCLIDLTWTNNKLRTQHTNNWLCIKFSGSLMRIAAYHKIATPRGYLHNSALLKVITHTHHRCGNTLLLLSAAKLMIYLSQDRIWSQCNLLMTHSICKSVTNAQNTKQLLK